jgi:DeoR/GlpR family transcriptional regulator of sugar metabolism
MTDGSAAASLRYGDAPARRRAILRQLHSVGFCAVGELARELQVSEMTVRRDLRQLQRDDQVRLVHGGASLPPGALETALFTSRAEANHEAKRQIAQRAAELIGPRDTVAIDAGTTAFQLARALPDEFAGCVVTHSVPVIQHMLSRPSVRLVGLGGDLYHASQAFVGPTTVDMASSLRVRTVFLGAAALDERGVYVAADIERPAKQALMGIADHVVLLVDHGKFATSAPVLLCRYADVGTLVTDQPPPAAVSRVLSAAGTCLVSARNAA